MTTEPLGKEKPAWLILIAVAAAHVALHLATNGNYGIIRDEYYYLACADRLAWGYVDQPPLSIALLAGAKALLGDSVFAIRLLPALAGGLLVVLAGLLAAELGGRRYSQSLAAICAFIAPSYLVITGSFSMNAFDLVLVPAAFLILIRIINTGNKRLWLVFGPVAGLALQNKIGFAVFGLSMAIGLAATKHRRHLRSGFFWGGAVIAGLIFLPHVIWQAANGWPTLEFIANATRYKIADFTPIQYFLGQVLENHPINAVVWLAGFFYLLVARRMRRYRMLAIAYLAAFALFAAQRSKVYYMAPLYPMLLAAGAIAVEAVTERRRLKWLRAVILALVAGAGLLTMPFGVPVLSVESFVEYQKKAVVGPPPEETNAIGVLPQYYADRFGWEEMAREVASVYEGLSPAQNDSCTIMTGNYGEAGAIDYYGGRHGLPRAVSGHNNYFLWGFGDRPVTVAICVGIPEGALHRLFESVVPAARLDSPYAMPSEARQTIYLCSGFRIPPEELWPMAKHYE